MKSIAQKMVLQVGVFCVTFTLALLVGAVLIALRGHAPSTVYAALFRATLVDPVGLTQVVFKATTLVFTGAAAAFAFRAGVFNIGAEGQLYAGAFVAGLEYAAQVEATVLGKPSPAYFEAALEALDAEPGLTWMVGDDLDSDIAGAQRYGLRTILVRTGKFRPDDLERSTIVPDAVVSSIAFLPEWLEQSL